MAVPGRNDPCSCGSGKKFKRCCGGAAAAPTPSTQAIHRLDNDLVERMLAFGLERYPDAFRQAIRECPVDERVDPTLAQVATPFMIYESRFAGAPLVEQFLEKEGMRLDLRERRWLEASRAAWLSIWEILEVEPGIALRLRDLLTGEERRVIERLGTEGMRPRLALCGRVVDADGISLLIGSHPRPLAPEETDFAVRAVRRILRIRKKHVPPEALRGDGAEVVLECWQEAVGAFDRRPLPKMQNTDGDELVLTEDRYDLTPGARASVEARLSDLEGFEEPTRTKAADGGETAFSVTRKGNRQIKSWDNTIVGRVVVKERTLAIETNSEARADALRRRVEDAWGRDVVHRDRIRKDAQDFLASSVGKQRSLPRRSSGLPTDVENRMVLEMKEKIYAAWPEEPVPALDGLTPFEAMKKPAMRRKVEVILKSMEANESHEPPGRRFDVGSLRERLGFDRE